jgi:ABC-type oligopeptide transport system ATPase subunit
MENENIISVKELTIKYPLNKNIFIKRKEYLTAVDKVSFTIAKGETLGLAGESGCGKSTIAKAILNVLQFSIPGIKISGDILLNTNEGFLNLTKIKYRSFRKYRGLIQTVFQDPYSSLNPRQSIGNIVEEPLLYNTDLKNKERKDRVKFLLDKVGIGTDKLNNYPFEFSGGQRQRINIARALATNPKLLIADEPISSLDVSIQAQIINLFKDLKNEFNLSMLFIGHDLSMLKEISDNIAIMYSGKIVETGTKEKVYFRPKHPYTKSLISSIPRINKKNIEIKN